MEPLLLQSARLGVSIRRQYQSIKRDPNARFYTYVLQLQNGKFYVGNTDNIYQRLLDHMMQTPSSALWVKLHGPVERVIEVSRNSAHDDELYLTLKYMSMFGWQHVRGSSYCKVDLHNPPAQLHSFQRTREGDFEYLTPDELREVVAAVEGLRDESQLPEV